MHRVRRFAVAATLIVSGFLGASASPSTLAAPVSFTVAAPSSAKVTITRHPGTVRRGATASVTITTATSATRAITVRYKSGPSTTRGLGPKQANASGVVSWAWKVGTRTTPGSWPVIISCWSQGTAQTEVRVP